MSPNVFTQCVLCDDDDMVVVNFIFIPSFKKVVVNVSSAGLQEGSYSWAFIFLVYFFFCSCFCWVFYFFFFKKILQTTWLLNFFFNSSLLHWKAKKISRSTRIQKRLGDFWIWFYILRLWWNKTFFKSGSDHFMMISAKKKKI
jgi:hypothetical protein